jgi:drug/metabolite transporter (DMT)-like permease
MRVVSRPQDWLLWSALLIVYVIWGSTYLGIRIVVETLPPLLAAGARFLVAGAIMALAVALRGGPRRLRVSRAELAGVGLVGTLLLVLGNGVLSIGEQQVPSALAALLIASVPLWVVLFRRLVQEPVVRGTLIGVAIGFVGVGLMVVPAGTSGGIEPLSLALVLGASVAWAGGSFLSTRVAMPRDPFVATAYEMLLGGAVATLASLMLGEHWPAGTSAGVDRSLVALGYLVVFGSLVAFTAYTWLLQNAPISRVATYAYVNPVVAVVLGFVVLGEAVTPAMLAGGAVIVLSVALVIRHEHTPPEVVPADVPEPA